MIVLDPKQIDESPQLDHSNTISQTLPPLSGKEMKILLNTIVYIEEDSTKNIG